MTHWEGDAETLTKCCLDTKRVNATIEKVLQRHWTSVVATL